MDPPADPPVFTEPATHVVDFAAVNPNSSHVPSQFQLPLPLQLQLQDHNHSHNHPPYDEMIAGAIRALNEEKGSSRQAIAKHIESRYLNLPESHSGLLTYHLKLLKNKGMLIMEKHSYKLPGSTPTNTNTTTTNVYVPPPPQGDDGGGGGGGAAAASAAAAAAAAVEFKRRGPGRPPKPKFDETNPNYFHQHQHHQPGPQLHPVYVTGPDHPQSSVFGTTGTGSVTPHPVFGTGPGPEPESVFVSLGLVDVPTVAAVADNNDPNTSRKRGRGRPPKPKNGPVSVAPLSVKKASGRPQRPKSMSVSSSSVLTVATHAGQKRGRGRPPRTGPVLGGGGVPVPVPLPVPRPRPRGRPKKKNALTPARPRGRPPKIAVGGELMVPVAAARGVLPVKRRGRPPRVGATKKPRKLTGRPLGRPRKGTTSIEVSALQQQQLMAYEDLKTKLEHVQSRIKLAVSVVKPYLNAEIAVGAIGALQELEELATMDASAPLNVQGQEPLLQN